VNVDETKWDAIVAAARLAVARWNTARATGGELLEMLICEERRWSKPRDVQGALLVITHDPSLARKAVFRVRSTGYVLPVVSVVEETDQSYTWTAKIRLRAWPGAAKLDPDAIVKAIGLLDFE
jgi:hypothetical protein